MRSRSGGILEVDAVEAVVEVGAEPARAHQGAQGRLLARDHPDVDWHLTVRADRAAPRPRCSTRSSLACKRHRQIADLVEKDGAVVRGRGRVPSDRARAGERAAAVSEELALDERFRDRCRSSP